MGSIPIVSTTKSLVATLLRAFWFSGSGRLHIRCNFAAGANGSQRGTAVSVRHDTQASFRSRGRRVHPPDLAGTSDARPVCGEMTFEVCSTSPTPCRSILDVVSVPALTGLRSRRSEIVETGRARGASRVRVVGSVARGDATEASDIDFLVDRDEGRGLFDLGGLLMDLQDLLGHSVDVVTETGMRSRVPRRVLDDAVEL